MRSARWDIRRGRRVPLLGSRLAVAHELEHGYEHADEDERLEGDARDEEPPREPRAVLRIVPKRVAEEEPDDQRDQAPVLSAAPSGETAGGASRNPSRIRTRLPIHPR